MKEPLFYGMLKLKWQSWKKCFIRIAVKKILQLMGAY